MKKITVTIELENPEQLLALQQQLQQSLAAQVSQDPLPEALRQTRLATGYALRGVDAAVQQQDAELAIGKAKLSWLSAKQGAEKRVPLLVKELKKIGLSAKTVSVVAELNHLIQGTTRAHEQRPVQEPWIDENHFTLATYTGPQKKVWDEAVVSSVRRYEGLTRAVNDQLMKLVSGSEEAFPVPADPKIAKAAKDAWALALKTIAHLGDQDEDLNPGTAYEATVYTAYARAFVLDDKTTVAKLFREARRNQDSLLNTFTDSMTQVAADFTEKEGLAWRDQHVAKQKKPGPR